MSRPEVDQILKDSRPFALEFPTGILYCERPTILGGHCGPRVCFNRNQEATLITTGDLKYKDCCFRLGDSPEKLIECLGAPNFERVDKSNLYQFHFYTELKLAVRVEVGGKLSDFKLAEDLQQLYDEF